MTASKLALATTHVPQPGTHTTAKDAAIAPLSGDSTSFSNASYYKSLDTFYALRSSAISGTATRFLDNSAPVVTPGTRLPNSLNRIPGIDTTLDASIAPSLWPVMGPITSGFGQREDPVLGTGEGEFHKGVDISAPLGTPIRATADGMVVTAGLSNGYGREVVIDHGHSLKTCYGHMSGFTYSRVRPSSRARSSATSATRVAPPATTCTTRSASMTSPSIRTRIFAAPSPISAVQPWHSASLDTVDTRLCSGAAQRPARLYIDFQSIFEYIKN